MARKKIRWGRLFEKAREKKKREKQKRLFIRTWIARAIHMLKGLNVDDHVGKKTQWQKKLNNIKRGEGRKISKVRKTIMLEW